MSAARRVLLVPVAAVRPYVLLKCTLLILAFDVWLTRIEHSGRYGAGGFNVAHFAWLDAIQPSVTPALTNSVITLTGFLAFALALAPRPPRWLLALTFLLYTWSWAMSMLDSYQHHYLLSIVLLAFVFFPRLRKEDVVLPRAPSPTPVPPVATRENKRSKKKPKRAPAPEAPPPPSEPAARAPTTAAWAYVVLAASVAIIYAYAAYSKTADEWLAGAALQRVVGVPASGVMPPDAEDPFRYFRAFAGLFGFEGARFYWLMGHSVVFVQIVCAAGYLLAPFRDVARSPVMRAFSWIALFTALSFHAGAEVMKLEIGWFSSYMMLFALVYLLPSGVVAWVLRPRLPRTEPVPSSLVGRVHHVLERRAVARLIVAAIYFVGTLERAWMIAGLAAAYLASIPIGWLLSALSSPKLPPSAAFASAAVGAIALALAGTYIDLPGAESAGVIAACMLGAGTIGLLVARGEARAIHPYGVAGVLGALSLLVAISYSTVRFDFYRNVGGDERRRGDLVAAYEAYVLANRYAPEGEGRRRQERELRGELQRRGMLPPR